MTEKRVRLGFALSFLYRGRFLRDRRINLPELLQKFAQGMAHHIRSGEMDWNRGQPGEIPLRDGYELRVVCGQADMHGGSPCLGHAVL